MKCDDFWVKLMSIPKIKLEDLKLQWKIFACTSMKWSVPIYIFKIIFLIIMSRSACGNWEDFHEIDTSNYAIDLWWVWGSRQKLPFKRLQIAVICGWNLRWKLCQLQISFITRHKLNLFDSRTSQKSAIKLLKSICMKKVHF